MRPVDLSGIFKAYDVRGVYPEDIEATIYSAVGIDWTTVRHDDPLGRGFEYVPKTGAFQFVKHRW